MLLHDLTREGTEWVERGSLTKAFGGVPGTCREEVVSVLGGGELGGFCLFFFFPFLRVFILGFALGFVVAALFMCSVFSDL